MRKLIAVIRPHHAERLCQELHSQDRMQDLVAYEALGGGRQWREDDWRGMDLLPKAVIEGYVEDGDLEMVTDTILATCRTGSIGDGKVFVVPVG